MSTYTQIYYHVVFSTKNRKPSLKAEHRRDLFAYILGIVKNNKSRLYRLNGVADHIHIFSSLHPTVCLADFVKALKLGTSQWIKKENILPDFAGWQDGYAAFTHSARDRRALMEYVRNQEEHHKKTSFREEYTRLLAEAGIEFDEKYLV